MYYLNTSNAAAETQKHTCLIEETSYQKVIADGQTG